MYTIAQDGKIEWVKSDDSLDGNMVVVGRK